MGNNFGKISFLRNGKICTNHNDALTNIDSVSSKLNDGEIVLVRYTTEENTVKTIVGYKYGNGSDGHITIVDTEKVEKAIKSLADTKAEISDIPDVTKYIDGVEYESDGENHSIVFYHGSTYIDSIDATPFLVDGMVEDVRIENENLIIDFNTASSKQDISIPLTEIFNPENYYNKTVVDQLLNEKEEEIKRANNDIFTLKGIVGDLGGNVVYECPDTVTNKSFTTLLGKNGTVKLTDDVTTGRFGPGMMANNKVKLNLAGHNLTFNGLTESSNYPGIMSRGTQEITIGGTGTIDAGQGICIEANGTNSIINLTGSTTTYQTNRTNGELVYCYTGTVNITNGTFKNNGSKYLLNCYDANYQNGTAKIIVTGGKFYDFDPGDNSAEGEHTSFLAEGYHTEMTTIVEDGTEHKVYTVKKT